jgi:N-acetylglucosamine-6-phosphate deacetylase
MAVIGCHNQHLIDNSIKKSIDFHCHGIGQYDFSNIHTINLEDIEGILAQQDRNSILTLYLPRENFTPFLSLMDNYNMGKKKGKFKHILGIALEGPLLASRGGTPAIGVWMPSKKHWEKLAECGEKGLIYVILSPDADFSENRTAQTDKPHNIEWIVETLLGGAVLPAPGHFTRCQPKRSAQLLQSIFDIVAKKACGPIISDHLLNDMPLNFKHAWRTYNEKINRETEIKQLKMDLWNLDTIYQYMGPVPSILIHNARKGLIKICQNFDGEHVDLSIIKTIVKLVGAENMLMMTDSIESKVLAGQILKERDGSCLLYQQEGIVAAGNSTVYTQVKNMLSIGLTEEEIHLITHVTPTKIIEQNLKYAQEKEAVCL